MEDKRKTFFKTKIKLWTEEHSDIIGKKPVKRKLIDDINEFALQEVDEISPKKSYISSPNDSQLTSLENVSPSTLLHFCDTQPNFMTVTAELHNEPSAAKSRPITSNNWDGSKIPTDCEYAKEEEVLDEAFEREFKRNYYRALHEDFNEVEKICLKNDKNHDLEMDAIVIEDTVVANNDENKEGNRTIKEQSKEPKNNKRKRRPRKVKINKSYLDFLPENHEPFEYDSSSWNDSTENGSNDDDDGLVGKRAFKKKKVNKKKNKQILRNTGQEYEKTTGKMQPKREIRPNPCIGKKCGNGCQEIEEERRKRLFEHYWSLSFQRQRDWLITMTKVIRVKRKRSKESARRTHTIEYYINENEGRRKVCQQFILSTLDIKQTYVQYTLANATSGSSKCDMRGKSIPPNKTANSVIQNVKNYIEKLPAVPSHFCRSDSSKVYIPTEIKSKKNLYRLYKEEQTNEGENYVSEKVFLKIFAEEYNIGIHVPKKDKCKKCITYDREKTDENEKLKEEHLRERDASQARFQFHREQGKDHPEMLCASFDLQKVLNTPYGDSILLYYSRKLAVYNECFYENNTREGFCYVWTETNGKRGANEIATILQTYIDMIDSRETVKYLILYSDSCAGQNKNRTVLAAIHNSLSRCKYIESIQMNYLLPGHTEMSVDSMHSVIEGSVKNTIVWAPSQWSTVCQLARKEPRPYQVHWFEHMDFKGYDKFADNYFKGNLNGKISKIRIASFKKDAMNVVKVKYSMQDGAAEEKIAVNGNPDTMIQTALYSEQLPIAKNKYKDLKKLCDTQTIPRLFKNEYLSLPYKTDVRDELNETDEED